MKKLFKIQVTDEVEAETVLKAKCIFCRRMLTDYYKLQHVEVVEVIEEKKEENTSCQPEH